MLLMIETINKQNKTTAKKRNTNLFVVMLIFSIGLMPNIFDSIRCDANINKTFTNKQKKTINIELLFKKKNDDHELT